ncbi:ABC transporter ATP-binding protein [Sutcliffiella rhizosphaerae]|uniref:Fe(3+) ions import ATP-binding protein FbpC n=1 Tax=Sutcliffiella rhizosphaerae TaxID=2880967 RepID=A0ABM8YJA1_9BACI|nr:ABC transporter ATP-binding protein [Sutcliffiella rhizosphaerae]CAG9619968.1 Fe(3+) ions import ATP-binding protein FbpC [Sutcliffiella rhizosphaerae]
MYIQIRDLQFQYKNTNKSTLDHIQVDIERGEIVSILGKSGSGKSTLLRIIAGLEDPTGGSMVVNGQVIFDKKTFIAPEKRGIGVVFQDYALFPHMTVAQNVKYGLRKMNRKQKQDRLEEMLSLINLVDYGHRYPYELSGGQQQRVALARALAPSPSLLLLDEPFSNLDAHLQEKIRDELKEILKKTGITSVFVTHDFADAKAIADRILYIDEGQLVNRACDLVMS